MTRYEPDYEQMRDDRLLDRQARETHVFEVQAGGDPRLYSNGPDRLCSCGKLWGEGQQAHDCRLLRDPNEPWVNPDGTWR